jgi:cytidylate kinase
MEKRKIIIAIDGHSSTGKSTFAKAISKRYGLTYVDTGALYRGVTLAAIRDGVMAGSEGSGEEVLASLLQSLTLEFRPAGKNRASELYLNGENIENKIRSLEVAGHVSNIASRPAVRNFVDEMLRQYGVKGGVVMDGRDIGTVVFPDADLKIFMTADPAIRAKRRYDELASKGEKADYEEVLKNIIERDHMDETRETAPLRRASDAILLDNSSMTQEDQMKWIEKILEEKWGFTPM